MIRTVKTEKLYEVRETIVFYRTVKATSERGAKEAYLNEGGTQGAGVQFKSKVARVIKVQL